VGPPGESPADAAGERERVVGAGLCCLPENFFKLGLQRTTVAAGASLQPLDNVRIEIAYQDVRHGSPLLLPEG